MSRLRRRSSSLGSYRIHCLTRSTRRRLKWSMVGWLQMWPSSGLRRLWDPHTTQNTNPNAPFWLAWERVRRWRLTLVESGRLSSTMLNHTLKSRQIAVLRTRQLTRRIRKRNLPKYLLKISLPPIWTLKLTVNTSNPRSIALPPVAPVIYSNLLTCPCFLVIPSQYKMGAACGSSGGNRDNLPKKCKGPEVTSVVFYI
jgi:hypothetical protein